MILVGRRPSTSHDRRATSSAVASILHIYTAAYQKERRGGGGMESVVCVCVCVGYWINITQARARREMQGQGRLGAADALSAQFE